MLAGIVWFCTGPLIVRLRDMFATGSSGVCLVGIELVVVLLVLVMLRVFAELTDACVVSMTWFPFSGYTVVVVATGLGYSLPWESSAKVRMCNAITVWFDLVGGRFDYEISVYHFMS